MSLMGIGNVHAYATCSAEVRSQNRTHLNNSPTVFWMSFSFVFTHRFCFVLLLWYVILTACSMLSSAGY